MSLPISAVRNTVGERPPLLAVFGGVVHGRVVGRVGGGQVVEHVVVRSLGDAGPVIPAVVVVVGILRDTRRSNVFFERNKNASIAVKSDYNSRNFAQEAFITEEAWLRLTTLALQTLGLSGGPHCTVDSILAFK